MERHDLLLEIGSEEIPASYLEPAADELRRRLCAKFEAAGIEYDAAGIALFTTPRRIAVRIPAVAAEEPTREEQKLGPAVAAAFDADGKPTKAAEGFARSAGCSVDELERVETDRGERLAAVVRAGGRKTRELLLEDGMLRELLQLGFPKTMRWIPGDDFAYARPIRWLLCLHGEEVVPLRLGELVAGRESRGHRTLSPGPVEIASPAAYEAALAARDVQVDAALRREQIERDARRVAEQAGGQLLEDSELVAEVAQLVEHPTPLVGHFASELVDILPKEVIVAAMRSHQRYFSVQDQRGKLLPAFITFRDGGERGLDHVREGNERVLRARLDDARFYWDEDRALSSDDKIERLGRIVWLEGFGSMRDKCERVRDLALALADEFEAGVDRDALARAAMLSKSDLATEMIRDGKEFTKLQGVIGRYYALAAGEDAAVADAIAEHLRPRHASDRLPEGELGALVALADRLDSIAGCVLAGFAPTGGADPYALRRQAFAVLRMLLERDRRTDLSAWIDRALAAFGEREGIGAARASCAELFWGRLSTLLSDLDPTIVRAVLTVSRLDPAENARFARALSGFAGGEDFAALVEGAKRCRNILAKEGRLAEEEAEGEADRAARLRVLADERFAAWRAGDGLKHRAELLAEDGERQLLDAIDAALPALAAAQEGEDPEAVYGALAKLGAPIGRFFDEILVNAEETELRENRLGLLEDIHYLFTKFADLRQIQTAS